MAVGGGRETAQPQMHTCTRGEWLHCPAWCERAHVSSPKAMTYWSRDWPARRSARDDWFVVLRHRSSCASLGDQFERQMCAYQLNWRVGRLCVRVPAGLCRGKGGNKPQPSTLCGWSGRKKINLLCGCVPLGEREESEHKLFSSADSFTTRHLAPKILGTIKHSQKCFLVSLRSVLTRTIVVS